MARALVRGEQVGQDAQEHNTGRGDPSSGKPRCSAQGIRQLQSTLTHKLTLDLGCVWNNGGQADGHHVTCRRRALAFEPAVEWMHRPACSSMFQPAAECGRRPAVGEDPCHAPVSSTTSLQTSSQHDPCQVCEAPGSCWQRAHGKL
jgi:hypothetical protein